KRLTLRNPDGTFAQYGMSAGQNWDATMMSMYGGFPTDRQVNPTKATITGNEALLKGLTEIFQSEYADRWTLGAEPLASGAFTAGPGAFRPQSEGCPRAQIGTRLAHPQRLPDRRLGSLSLRSRDRQTLDDLGQYVSKTGTGHVDEERWPNPRYRLRREATESE